jgi:hypothetical protein
MRFIVLLSLILFLHPAVASECALVLNNLVKIITNNGGLAPGKNVYRKKFSASDFDDSCSTAFGGKEYLLYLHPDDVTIVVAHTDPASNITKYQGPFYSAYKK